MSIYGASELQVCWLTQDRVYLLTCSPTHWFRPLSAATGSAAAAAAAAAASNELAQLPQPKQRYRPVQGPRDQKGPRRNYYKQNTGVDCSLFVYPLFRTKIRGSTETSIGLQFVREYPETTVSISLLVGRKRTGYSRNIVASDSFSWFLALYKFVCMYACVYWLDWSGPEVTPFMVICPPIC